MFTRGGTIEHGVAYPIRIDRPLDFAAVTDHAEYMGAARQHEAVLVLEERSLRERLLNDGPLHMTLAFIGATSAIAGGDFSTDTPALKQVAMDTWVHMIETADRHYQPGH